MQVGDPNPYVSTIEVATIIVPAPSEPARQKTRKIRRVAPPEADLP
jgi:hypothetical protein